MLSTSARKRRYRHLTSQTCCSEAPWRQQQTPRWKTARRELGPLRSRDRDRLVHEFAELDKRVIANATHRVMDKANARRPSAIVGVASIIQNEAQKKKRHMPVAELLSRTTEVAQAIKPCFMMSPLSVSQYLPADIVFDLVIFDEASQVKPCDAVNALYRGEAMIVAGDEKQLPPSSFFDRATDDGDGWEEEEFAEVESVLGQSKRSGTFRSLPLTWHYRSRHENLIAFSNHRFYGGAPDHVPERLGDGARSRRRELQGPRGLSTGDVARQRD